GEIFTERRTYIPFEEIPKLVTNAFIAAEDADFYKHQGLDYWGMLRALYINLRERSRKQGASTITQQVVKTFFLSREKKLRRKIQEIILARRLEDALSKEEILALYLNQIYFGHGRYGIREAARFYFGKAVKDLHAGEAALLAGLPKGPERYSPKKSKNRERAKTRQKYVLEQMAHLGFISADEAKKWVDEPIAVVRDPFPEMGAAPEWVDEVRRELTERYGEEAINTLGAQVVTTMDLDIQRAATRALRRGLQAYDERRKYGRPVRSVKVDKIELELAKLARKLPKDGPKRDREYLAVVRAVHDSDAEVEVDLGNWPASFIVGGDEDDLRYNPADAKTGERKQPSQRFAPGDVVRVYVPPPGRAEATGVRPKHAKRLVELARGPEGAVVVIEPETRRVLAMVGGYSNRVGDFNRALRAARQPGSTFKPLVYAAAIASGEYTAASIINDAPEVYDLWKPQNYKKGKFEGPVRLRHALAKSINTVAIRVLNDVGVVSVVELARDMGISSKLPAELSLALGSGEVYPIELTNTFATLVSGGQFAPARFVAEVSGEKTAAAAGEEALSPEVAYIVTDMMTSVVNSGTARQASKLKLPIAGKTGTSNDARDAWFIGMTPGYAVGVWIGYDNNAPLGRGESGGTTALPVFIDLMEAIGDEERGRKFTAPSGVSRVAIDKVTGLLAPENAGSDSSYKEVFISGTEPVEIAPSADEAAAADFVQDEYDDDYGEDVDGTGGDEDGFEEMDEYENDSSAKKTKRKAADGE
ncbi:MAG: PBP1A family penicillin-binding protein, partial [Myxococcota bacterium]